MTHVVLAVVDLGVLVTAALAVLVGRRRRWAWLLLVSAGLWLPLDNRVLEGPVVLPVSGSHGLTVSDLLGVAGVVTAGLRLFPPQPGRSGRWFASRWGVVAAVILVGFGTAAVDTDLHRTARARAHTHLAYVHAQARAHPHHSPERPTDVRSSSHLPIHARAHTRS